MDQEKIERALDACYDAILAPETWPEALHVLSRAVGAVGCRLRGPTGRGILELPMSPNLRDFVAEFGRDGWWRNDHRAKRGWPLVMSGTRVLVDHDITTDEERRRLPLLNELSRRHDFPWWAGVGLRVAGGVYCLSFFRDGRRGPFSHSEAQRLAKLQPQLVRLIHLSGRFALGQAQAQLDVVDRLACAAFLIDWKGVVIGTNAKAVQLLGADLQIRRDVLTAADAESNRQLQSLVLHLRTSGSVRDGLGSVIVRREGRLPLRVDALPVAGRAADAFSPALAILVVADLQARPAPLEGAALREAFGLTPAEARLASRLAGGERLEDTAEALGIAKETARSQLRAVFAKTGTSRQAELVALLMRLPPARAQV